MKKILVLSSLGLIVLALSSGGCQKDNVSNQPHLNGKTREAVFPEIMVGVWQAEVNQFGEWGFKFERDGSIRKIVHPLAGPMRLTEGGVYLEGKEPNTHAVFVMGPVEAKYLPDTGRLKVTVILDRYEMVLPAGELKGRIESYFSGPVSEDGQTWEVELIEFGWLEGAAEPDIEGIRANPEKMVFTKVDLEALKEEQSP